MSQVLPISGQTDFEGLTVEQHSFSLRSTNDLWTPEPLHHYKQVRGLFTGWVSEVKHVAAAKPHDEVSLDDLDRRVLRKHMVTVLDAKLSPRCGNCHHPIA